MTSSDTPAASEPAIEQIPATTAPAADARPAIARFVADDDAGDAVPPPKTADTSADMHTRAVPDQDVATWITKEAGNRRIPPGARLERSTIHPR